MTAGNPNNRYPALAGDEAKASLIESDVAQCDQFGESPPQSVTAAFFFLGLGVLLPWNVLLSTIDFYSVLFPKISVAQYMTNVNTFPFMLAGIVAALSSGLSKRRRFLICFGFASVSILTALLPVLSASDTPIATVKDALASNELRFTLLATAIIGAITAVIQSLLFGLVGMFPGGKCAAALSTGIGVASIFVAALRIFFRLIMDDDSQGILKALQSGFNTFLLTCSLLCGCCIAVFIWLDRFSTYYAYYVPTSYAREEEPKTYAEAFQEALGTLNLIRVPSVCALVSFSITLSLFPGILVKIPIPLREIASVAWKSWYPLVVVTTFAIGDTIGRSFPTEKMVLDFPNALPILTGTRALIVPVYLLQWTGMFPMNWVAAVAMVLALGIANGLVATWALLMIPSLTPLDQRELAGRSMFVMFISGISIGNLIGWMVELAMRCATSF